MKKRIVALIMCFMFSLSILTGCSLITRNYSKYYNEVVARVDCKDGHVIEITKKDLISGFNTFGYSYVENYNLSMKDAVERTLDSLISRELTIKEVKDILGEDCLSDGEKTYLWDQTYNALINNLKSYYEDIVGSLSTDQDENTGVTYNPYTKTSTLVYDVEKDSYKIEKKTTDETIEESYTARYSNVTNKDGTQTAQAVNYEFKDSNGNYFFKDVMYSKIAEDLVNSSTNWRKAYSNYLKDLKNSEKNLGFSTVNKEIFYREMDRIYEVLYKNYMVEKYETIYNKSLGKDAKDSNVSINTILEYYSAKVRQSYTKYEIEGGDYDADILSGESDIYYHKNTGTQYFYVSSIFMSFSEEQSALYEEIQNNNGKWSDQECADKLEELNSMMSAKVYDEKGNVTDGRVSAKVLLSEINTYLPKVSNTTDLSADELANYYSSLGLERAEFFNDYLYKYNEDEQTKNAEYNYVVGVNSTGEAVFGSGLTQEYADAAVRLYNDGKAVVGDVLNELVYTDKGAYILFYAGNIENLYTGIDENFDLTKNPNSISVLNSDSARLSIFNTKTIFDSIYSELVSDNYSIFESMNINVLKSSDRVTIKYYTSAYKDLY